ncbi:MAG: DUF58 domain-containing protein [Elusimicrobiota bacterium]
MTLRARYVAEGYTGGLHQSPFRGASLEFAQHRQYAPGDELKYIDWKIFARTDRYYVKQFQEETNLRGYSIIDTSSSMGYTSSDVTKLEYATYLSAAITYLMIKQHDSAGLITFGDSIGDFIPPRNFSAHLQHVLEKLDGLRPSGRTDFHKSFDHIGKRITKRSLLVVFSDLLEDTDILTKALKFFPYLKNDLIVFHILDPEEINFRQSGPVEYHDMETRGRVRTYPEIIRKEYRKNIKAYLKNIELNLRSHNIDYCRITTDMTLDKALSKFMEGRKKILI